MPQSSSSPSLFKLVIIGDSGIGKTNLLTRYSHQNYKQHYTPTIGVDFTIKYLTLQGHKIKLQIWDTAGQQRFKNITQTFYKGANGIVMCYAIDDQQSFRSVRNWCQQVDSVVGQDVPRVLVGTKNDLEGMRKVSREEAAYYARSNSMEWKEVSAKTGHSIQEPFVSLAQVIKDRRGARDEKEGQGMRLAGGSLKGHTCLC